ncbi:MAG: hypothetical protein ABFD63_05485, partial [Smithella sp.]
VIDGGFHLPGIAGIAGKVKILQNCGHIACCCVCQTVENEAQRSIAGAQRIEGVVTCSSKVKF